jgi:inner membrane transporter RhtA
MRTISLRKKAVLKRRGFHPHFLMSIEPAIAALVGLLFLRETLEVRSLIAIALVIMAAIGATMFGKQDSAH